MATPIITGTLAVLLSRDTSLTTISAIRNKIITNSSLLLQPLYNSSIKGSNQRITLTPKATAANYFIINLLFGKFIHKII